MKLWMKVAVSVGLLALLFAVIPWSDLREGLARLPPGLWALVLLGFIAGHLVGVFKWRLFINAGRAALRAVDAVQCYEAGLFANLCLPSIVGGDVLRIAMAGSFTSRPEAALWGGVLDRVTDVASLAILVTGGALLAGSSLPGMGGELLLVAIVLAGFATMVAAPFVLRRPLVKWPRKLRRPIGRSLVAIRRLSREPGTAVAGLGLSLVIQSSFVLLNAELGAAIGVTVPVAVWFLVWPLAKIASLMPISLGGLAVREASLAALLAPFGTPIALGVLASLLWQTVLIGGGLAGGLTWLVLAQRRSTRNQPVRIRHV